MTHDSASTGVKRIDADRSDLVSLCIAFAAIGLFIAIGGRVIPQVFASLTGTGPAPDKALISALLLNIALIVLGLHRYRELLAEVRVRMSSENSARMLAQTDPLTGCLNRLSFSDATDALISDCHGQGECVAVIMIDLDRFKKINDYNGHKIGDELLVESVRRIRSVMPERAVLARLGGDEFAAIVPFSPRRSDFIGQIAARLNAALAQPASLSGVVVHPSASVGIARSDGNADPASAQTLLHMADIAMYQAKREGRNCHFWFEGAMEEELRFRTEMEIGIRDGIVRGEFVPYYERQIDLQTGEITGFEVLARWNSPKLGLVMPDTFIPIAEEIGAIGALSESVIAQALADAQGWDKSLTLAVNISPLQLRDPWFAQKLLKLLVEANFPPERLEIEITESCLLDNITVVRTLITSLKNQGIRISLDDFGTGYSSLAQLKDLPFDRIKIDRSFVSGLEHDVDAQTIVHAIALLGQGLGLPVTAEGIESADILERLRQYGDIKGQGYLYGRPQPASAVNADFAERPAEETAAVTEQGPVRRASKR